MRRVGIILIVVLVLFLAFIIAQIRPDLSLDELKIKYANSASRFLNVNGLAVHYRSEGNGPVLVLLHGTGASLHTWDAWTKELRDGFRIIRMDLPGFGLTGPDPSRDYSMSHYIDFLAAFLDSLQISRCHIAGNSLGGHIAWRFALAHPERVSRMILIDASGYPTAGLPMVFKIARTPMINALVRWMGSHALVKKSLLEVYADDRKVTDELVQRYYDLARRAGNRKAFIDRANTNFEDKSAEISHLTAPTLILWGAEDRWVPVELARRFHKDIANSQLLVYDGVGHVPMEEIPERSAQDARKFLFENGAN